MPRRAAGPKLVLFGPDDKHGAKPKDRFTEYVYYIVWREDGKRQEKSTGARLGSEHEAEIAFNAFLSKRIADRAPPGGYRPHEVMVETVLQRYASDKTAAAETDEQRELLKRISYGIEALLPFWAGKLLSEVGKQTCVDYGKWRTGQTTRNYQVSLKAWKRRKSLAWRSLKRFTSPEPEKKFVALRTARTELEYLRAAITHCRAIPFITDAPIVTLPEKGESRDVWLTTTDFAKILHEAREPVIGKKEARRHLIVYLMVAVYQPARKKAILGLPLVQHIDRRGWIDAEAGVIDFGTGTGKKKRPRRVPLHPKLLVYVRGAARRNQTYLVEARGPGVDAKGNWVKDMLQPVKDVRHSFAKAVRRANLGKRVTPHSLRHTGVTWLKQAGKDSWKVGEYAGMTKETVDRIYAHSSPSALQDLVEATTKRGRR